MKPATSFPMVIYPGLDRGELVEWVERFYGEYFFRPRVIWRIVRKAIFNTAERRRLTKEAREYMALRSKRKKFVAGHKAASDAGAGFFRRLTRIQCTSETARLRSKTWACAAIVVLTQVFGNFFLKRGMPAELPSPLSYITVLFRPWVALGVSLLIVWLLSRMTLLSWADLSYVLPVTSLGYVLVALVGRWLLEERITGTRWAGILLIMAGVALVGGGTAPQTFRGNSESQS